MANPSSNVSYGRSKIQHASWDALDSRRAEPAPLRTGVILDANFKSKFNDYSFRRAGVILDAYFKSMLPTLRVCCLL